MHVVRRLYQSATMRRALHAVVGQGSTRRSALHIRARLSLLGREAYSTSSHSIDDELYTSDNLTHFLGPLAPGEVAGKGRGMLAKADIQAGQLLLVSPALAILQGAVDHQPSPEDFVRHLQTRKWTRPEMEWLRCLHDGMQTPKLESVPADFHTAPGGGATAGPAHDRATGPAATANGAAAKPLNTRPKPSVVTQEPHHPAHQQCQHPTSKVWDPKARQAGSCAHPGHHHRHPPPAVDPTAANHSSSSSSSSEEHVALAYGADQLTSIVRYNAFGDDYEDLASAAVKGHEPHSHVGLWPHFSLFNHSCLPNTIHYVTSGTCMTVRAITDIPKGEEVLVSYLGREEYSPASVRQELLLERYGFKCSCPRCAAEAQLDPGLQQYMLQLYNDVTQQCKPHFMAALSNADEQRLAAVSLLLQRKAADFAQRIAGLEPNNRMLAVLQSVVYDLFELQYFCHSLAGHDESALHAMGVCLDILDDISVGAELHCFAACKLVSHTIARYGYESPQTEAAAKLCEIAHLARYGHNLSDEVFVKLVEQNKRLSEEYL